MEYKAYLCLVFTRKKKDRIITAMKNFIVRAIVAMLVYIVFNIAFDAIWRELKPVGEYLVSASVFGLLFGLFLSLDSKGWNSWKRVGELFKRKKTE